MVVKMFLRPIPTQPGFWRNVMKETFAPVARFAHWGLRLTIASVFLFHGLPKIANPASGAMMGMNSGLWLLVGLMEVGAGVFAILGAFLPDWATRLSGALVLPPMLGAIATVHWGQWSFLASETHPAGGMEFQFTLLMIGLYFLLKGKEI
jgi:putative oxidoreductase